MRTSSRRPSQCRSACPSRTHLPRVNGSLLLTIVAELLPISVPFAYIRMVTPSNIPPKRVHSFSENKHDLIVLLPLTKKSHWPLYLPIAYPSAESPDSLPTAPCV